MDIYNSFFLFIILADLIFLYKRPLSSVRKKYSVIIITIVLCLIGGLRYVYPGTDAARYIHLYFEKAKFNDLSYYWNNFIQSEGKDPFFYLVMKLMSMTGISSRIWLASICAFYLACISRAVYKYSENIMLSYLLLICLGYFSFSLNGLRQAVAIGFTFCSYTFVREEKPIKFILTVLLASLFHSTAIVFLIAYPIAKIQLNWKSFLFYFFTLIVLGLLGKRIIEIFVNIFVTDEYYSGYASSSETYSAVLLIVYTVILCFCLFYKKQTLENDEKNLALYNYIIVGILLQLLSSYIAIFFRLSMYFSMFQLLLLPNCFEARKDNSERLLIYYLCIVAFIIYTNYVNRDSLPYLFMWQM